METVQEIYDSTISRLPSEAQIQLASLILEKVVEAQYKRATKPERRSVLDILKDWPDKGFSKHRPKPMLICRRSVIHGITNLA